MRPPQKTYWHILKRREFILGAGFVVGSSLGLAIGNLLWRKPASPPHPNTFPTDPASGNNINGQSPKLTGGGNYAKAPTVGQPLAYGIPGMTTRFLPVLQMHKK